MGKSSTSFQINHPSSSLIDETGNQYGNLTVISRAPNNKYHVARWLCLCGCGNYITVIGQRLRNGKVGSCGCLNTSHKRSGNTIYKKMHALTRWQCKQRGVPFDLSWEDVRDIVNKECSYCGRQPYTTKYAYHRSKLGIKDEALVLNGIDRVVPNLGYIMGNVVSCCKYCNRAKSDLSLDEFKILITNIYHHTVCES